MDNNILNRGKDWAAFDAPNGREWEYHYMDTLSNSKGRGEPSAEKWAKIPPTPAVVPTPVSAKVLAGAKGLLNVVGVFCFVYVSLYCMGAAVGLVLGAGMATFNAVVGK